MISMPAPPPCPRPFSIDLPPGGTLRSRLLGLVRRPLESLLACDELNDIYARIRRAPDDRTFSQKALSVLGVGLEVSDADLARIPTTGPLVVVANHPFGGIDGLVLAALLERVRPDVKIMANRLLNTIPELRERWIMVDVFGAAGASTRNLGAVRTAVRWVKAGGAMAVFPAGEVSSLGVGNRCIADREWSPMVGRFVRQTGAAVLPVFFEGRNSTAFYLAGLLHPRLRTLLLPHELLRRRRSRVRVHVGSAVEPKRLARFETAADVTSYLRVRTYVLKGRTTAPPPPPPPPPAHSASSRSAPAQEPIAESESIARLIREVANLPTDHCLATTGPMRVLLATAVQIPTVLREIGRLRELSFRGVGEGTGNARDLDRFDQYYSHLFVWDEKERQVVGAYRMGFVDRIVREHGADGLYTSTLFHYGPALLEKLGDAIELGRSFVRPEYQKEVAPLALLWKGLARTAAMEPRYKRLFGPVSISDRYTSMSKRLLVAFLRMSHIASDLSDLIRGKNPPRLESRVASDPRLTGTVVRDVDEVDELLSEIEQDRLTTPVLLRQYLKLNAKLLGFNVDPQFGDVLDALMIVDLTKVQRAILYRYMGPEDARGFLAYHGIQG